MKASIRNAMTALLLISSLAMPTTSYAWFFFFIPGGLFSNNDKKTVTELEQKKDWNGMHELAAKRLEANNKDVTWLGIDGYALLNLNRCSESIPQSQKAIELKPDYKEARINLGLCQMKTGQLDDAIATLTDSIGKNPEVWQAYYNMGLVYVRKSDPTNARIYLEQLKSRNMVSAVQLENQIVQLETALERGRIAAANREKEENERIERERLAKEESDAKAKAEAEAKANLEANAAATAEKSRLAAIEAAKTPPKSLEDQLKELKQLYGKGLITREVYNQRQKELLNRN